MVFSMTGYLISAEPNQYRPPANIPASELNKLESIAYLGKPNSSSQNRLVIAAIDDVPNKTIWSFGPEFIDFKALSPSSTPAERQEFPDAFLLTTRTLSLRMIRVGIRFDF